jgi:hypothetical protein
MPKGLASRYWEEIILALIGGQFAGVPDGEICGAVLSVRYSEDILGVWNRTAADRDMVERIRDAIKRVLQLPPAAHMEYKPHQASLQDRSSFRNTSVWKPKSSPLDGRSAHDMSAAAAAAAAVGGSSSATHGTTTATTATRRQGSWSERERGPGILKQRGDRGGSWRQQSSSH